MRSRFRQQRRLVRSERPRPLGQIVVAITGLVGKTTTAWHIAEGIRRAGHDVLLIATWGSYLNGERIGRPRQHTIPRRNEIPDIAGALGRVPYVVMEAPAESILHGRVSWFAPWHIAVQTLYEGESTSTWRWGGDRAAQLRDKNRIFRAPFLAFGGRIVLQQQAEPIAREADACGAVCIPAPFDPLKTANTTLALLGMPELSAPVVVPGRLQEVAPNAVIDKADLPRALEYFDAWAATRYGGRPVVATMSCSCALPSHALAVKLRAMARCESVAAWYLYETTGNGEVRAEEFPDFAACPTRRDAIAAALEHADRIGGVVACLGHGDRVIRGETDEEILLGLLANKRALHGNPGEEAALA